MKNKLLAAALFSIVSVAQADVTYTYIGNPMEDLIKGAYTEPFVNPIHATFVVSDDGTDLLNWSLYQRDSGTVSMSDMAAQAEKNGREYENRFNIETDSSGAPVSWDIEVHQFIDRYFDPVNFQTMAHLTVFNMSSSTNDLGHNDILNHYNYNHSAGPYILGVNQQPGTWYYNALIPNMNLHETELYNAPLIEVSPVPEPETYAMMLLGLMIVAAYGYRSREPEYCG